MSREIAIIYHGGCADGLAAAWVVWQRLRNTHDVTFTPMPATHGDPMPPHIVGLDVIMVDFCYPKHIMAILRSTCPSMLVIDHHVTAFKTLEDWSFASDCEPWLAYYAGHMPSEDLPGAGLATFTDVDRSGAVLAWDFFHPGVEAPALLQYVQDRDLWHFNLPSSRAVAEWIASIPSNLLAWEGAVEAVKRDPGWAVARGGAILEYKQKCVEELAASAVLMTLGGHTVPVCNSYHGWGSDVAEALLQSPSGYWPFSAYYYDGKDGRNFGLRSTAPNGMDVSAIAQRYGGGGHKHAAGFRVPHGWRGDP